MISFEASLHMPSHGVIGNVFPSRLICFCPCHCCSSARKTRNSDRRQEEAKGFVTMLLAAFALGLRESKHPRQEGGEGRRDYRKSRPRQLKPGRTPGRGTALMMSVLTHTRPVRAARHNTRRSWRELETGHADNGCRDGSSWRFTRRSWAVGQELLSGRFCGGCPCCTFVLGFMMFPRGGGGGRSGRGIGSPGRPTVVRGTWPVFTCSQAPKYTFCYLFLNVNGGRVHPE